MASAQVEPEDVRDILNTGLNDVQLEAFIAAARLMVDRHLAPAGYNTNELFELERWLAAHFAVARERPLKSESVSGASDTYDTVTGLGLDGSYYGQQVKIMDSRGILLGLNKRRAVVTWMGRR